VQLGRYQYFTLAVAAQIAKPAMNPVVRFR
jgi:hypothetical protein